MPWWISCIRTRSTRLRLEVTPDEASLNGFDNAAPSLKVSKSLMGRCLVVSEAASRRGSFRTDRGPLRAYRALGLDSRSVSLPLGPA